MFTMRVCKGPEFQRYFDLYESWYEIWLDKLFILIGFSLSAVCLSAVCLGVL